MRSSPSIMPGIINNYILNYCIVLCVYNMCGKNGVFISHVNWCIILGVFTSNVAPVWVVWFLRVIFLISLKVTGMVVHCVYKCLNHGADRLIWGVSLIVSIFMDGFIEGCTL